MRWRFVPLAASGTAATVGPAVTGRAKPNARLYSAPVRGDPRLSVGRTGECADCGRVVPWVMTSTANASLSKGITQ